jgi:sugar/nucleoside kinase (ribokinase family)
MKNYDIVALGNALVDKEYTVSTQFLIDNNIEKGFMTLYEEEPHTALLNNLNASYQLRKKASGGCAANTLVTAAQLGARTYYCCRVGNDETGDFYKSDLSNADVEHDLASREYEGTTGTCVVMVTDDADRTMCTHLGITTDFSVIDVNEDAIKTASYLYIEGHLMYQEQAVDAILHAMDIAQKHQVKIAVTFSDPSVVNYAKSNLQKVLDKGGVDIIFCNQDEVTAWSDSFEASLKELNALSNTLVVTKGENGATIYANDTAASVNAPSVKALDTTGAGDTFAGAFMYGLTHGLSLEQCGHLACRCGAECVKNFGPRIDKQIQAEILKEIISQ